MFQGLVAFGHSLAGFMTPGAIALVLVGHGLPFWLATGVFVAAFIFGFDRARQTALGRSTARQLMLAAICGAVTSAVVTLVFQDIFYVRLP